MAMAGNYRGPARQSGDGLKASRWALKHQRLEEWLLTAGLPELEKKARGCLA